MSTTRALDWFLIVIHDALIYHVLFALEAEGSLALGALSACFLNVLQANVADQIIKQVMLHLLAFKHDLLAHLRHNIISQLDQQLLLQSLLVYDSGHLAVVSEDSLADLFDERAGVEVVLCNKRNVVELLNSFGLLQEVSVLRFITQVVLHLLLVFLLA